MLQPLTFKSKEKFITYVNNLWKEGKGIVYIAIKWIENREIAKKLYKLWASHSFNHCQDYKTKKYNLLYHTSNKPGLNFKRIIDEIKKLNLWKWVQFTIGPYLLSEYQKRLIRKQKEEQGQKELRKIFKHTERKIRRVSNDLTTNTYVYWIDEKNKLYAMTRDSPLDNTIKIYKYRKLDKNWFPIPIS